MNPNFKIGTRPALTMSVPVRYSAAANKAVVDSGLLNTLQQEEQYHNQQQQHHPENHQQYFNHQEQQQYQQQQEQQQQQQNYFFGQQQQLMQQRSSMSSSVNTPLPIINTVNPVIVIGNKHRNKKKNKKMMMMNHQQQHHQKHLLHHKQKHQQQKVAAVVASASSSSASTSSSTNVSSSTSATSALVSVEPMLHDEYVDDNAKPMTSAMAASTSASVMAAARATSMNDNEMSSCNNNNNNNNINNSDNSNDDVSDNNNAEMRTEWMRMSDEGRYGTPGAAGLEYQKFEQEQTGIAPLNNNNNNNTHNDETMEPSLMDNEMITTTTTNTVTTELNENAITNNSSNMEKTDVASTSKITGTPPNNNINEELCAMSSEELYNILKEYDALQDKYHTVLLLPKESRREVTAGGRDGSAYVLRCLKMWYELPSDVLFSAMSLVDRFLDRMAVKPKHMACMSVASFHLAIKQLNLKPIPADDLVTISQCGCTAGDLERMAGVIANKLGVQMGHSPITSVSYLRIYYALFHNLAKEIGGQFFEFYQQLIKLEELENRLEILLCDVKTTVITPSTLALVLICLHLDFHIKESYTRGSPELKHVFEYILFLQQYMRIPDRVFTCGFSIVSGILSHYNGQNKQPYKQRLVWKLSSRTLRVLRPTNRFSSDLPTIEEGISNTIDDNLRLRTESLSSEEEEDWPTSAMIPIFEQC